MLVISHVSHSGFGRLTHLWVLPVLLNKLILCRLGQYVHFPSPVQIFGYLL